MLSAVNWLAVMLLFSTPLTLPENYISQWKSKASISNTPFRTTCMPTLFSCLLHDLISIENNKTKELWDKEKYKEMRKMQHCWAKKKRWHENHDNTWYVLQLIKKAWRPTAAQNTNLNVWNTDTIKKTATHDCSSLLLSNTAGFHCLFVLLLV